MCGVEGILVCGGGYTVSQLSNYLEVYCLEIRGVPKDMLVGLKLIFIGCKIDIGVGCT